ncbi:MAG: crossover junction endodeoxyribonuclease RuvC, partial [Sutterella sp.]|nr:crossover junction endodeoxyribonuclease RuvC [Sutterella sp.]
MDEKIDTTLLRILGVDPGLNHTGFGVIDVRGNAVSFVTA